MRTSRTTVVAALAAALVACSAPPAPTPPPVPPVITSFKADQNEVTAGTQVKLTFTTERAKEVSLMDQSGALIATTGDASAGEATVSPTQTSFYVLRATGDGGKDSAFVQVAVNEGLRQVFLVAVPGEIDSGDEVTIAWAALGGTGITLKDASGATLSMAEQGSLSQTPPRSTDYTLRATGLLGPLTATTQVKVRPLVKSFTATPPAAKQGEKLSLQWKTAGAESLDLSESSFGPLVTITSQASVDEGSFDFTIPADFSGDAGTVIDGGTTRPVPDNFPMHFTLTARTATPAQAVSKSLDAYVRMAPTIVTFVVPPFVTEGKPATMSWTASGAYRAELLLDGAPVAVTVPPATANGSFTHPAVTADFTATLVLYDFNGLSVRQTKTVKVAKAPKVNTFTLPTTIAAGGGSAAATWTTLNASQLVLRPKGGPSEFMTDAAPTVASGSTTLHPGRTTTYVLEAYNAAGDIDSMEKTVSVSVPLSASATPNPTAPNGLVTLSWDVGSANPSEVVGIPLEPPMSNAGSTAFFDIDGLPGATKLAYSTTDNATVSFSVGFGFVFPVVGQPVSLFSASTNGFLALQPTTTSTAANVDLKGTSSLPAFAMLAPFWDDLDLGVTGSVQWRLDGSAFPRRLIVQWTHVHLQNEMGSDLTFQVQAFENGEFRFIYKTLQASTTNGQGASATVGVYLGPLFAGQFSYNTASLAEGLELDWFTNGPSLGSRAVVVGSQSFTPGFFYKTATGGNWVWVTIPVRVVASGSIVLNEALPTAAAGVTEGQYVELFNPGSSPVDLGGLELSTQSTPAQTFLIPPSTSIPAGGYLVVGQSQVAANNGGAPVDVGYGGSLVMTGADTAALKVLGSLFPDGGPVGPYTVSTYAFGASSAGVAVQRDPALGGGIPACTYTQSFGTASQLGTPGKVNESCFPYTLTSIAPAYEDVSDGGPMFSTSFWDTTATDATLPMPFTYFGSPSTALHVCSNGWLSVKPGETSSTTGNKTAPGSGAPIGAIAPFWDDLAIHGTIAGTISNAFTRRVGDHQVVQWNKASPYFEASTTLDFEAKLFDDGRIEFHYAGMVNQPGGVLADGREATVWIEMPDGGGALPYSINQPLVMPNTALRFTPKP